MRKHSSAPWREAQKRWQAEWPTGWYRSVIADRALGSILAATRQEEEDVHQLRAGHWGRSNRPSTHHPVRPVQRRRLPGGLCLVCGEETDTPAHVLLRCLYLLGPRLRALATINPTKNSIQRDAVVVVLAAGYLAYKSADAQMQRQRPEHHQVKIIKRRTEVWSPHRLAGGG